MQKHSLCQISFNCNTCGKSYAYKGSLERHMKMHYMGGGDATKKTRATLSSACVGKSVEGGTAAKEYSSDEGSIFQSPGPHA